MNKKIIAALVIAAFAVAGVAVGAVAAGHRDAQGRRTSGDADTVTYDTPTAGTESTDQDTESETHEPEPTTGPMTQESETNPEVDEPEQSEFIWPDESYIGTWHSESKMGRIKILEITDDSIKFDSQIVRTLTVHATAMEKNGEILFGEDIAPCICVPTNKASGKLIFEKDSVTIIYGETFEPPLDSYNGRDYKCTVFEELHTYEPPEEEITEKKKRVSDGMTDEEWAMQNRVIPDVIPEFNKDSFIVFSPEEVLEKVFFETTFLPSYRKEYYRTPTFLFDLVDHDDYLIWRDEVVTPDIENNEEPKEMYTVSFIKFFRITKEEFEKALEYTMDNLYRHKVWKDGKFVLREDYEPPNADIIYTFDNDIINEYYRR